MIFRKKIRSYELGGYELEIYEYVRWRRLTALPSSNDKIVWATSQRQRVKSKE
jgi:hypothetical protein